MLVGTQCLLSTEQEWPHATPDWRLQVSTTLQCRNHNLDSHLHLYSKWTLKVNLPKLGLLEGLLSQDNELQKK